MIRLDKEWNGTLKDKDGNTDLKYVNGKEWMILFFNESHGGQWEKDGDEDKDGKYIGEIKNREPSGQGTFTYPDGEKYVGEWKDGRKSGQGTLTYSDGEKYVGEFKDGERNGQGTYTWFHFPKGIKHQFPVQTEGMKEEGLR